MIVNFIADMLNVDPRSVHAYSMGEHGDSQMVPWSVATVAGKPLVDIFKDNKAMTRKDIIDAFKRLLDFYALTGKPFKLIDRDPYHL